MAPPNGGLLLFTEKFATGPRPEVKTVHVATKPGAVILLLENQTRSICPELAFNTGGRLVPE
jgi:hypothetical protein